MDRRHEVDAIQTASATRLALGTVITLNQPLLGTGRIADAQLAARGLSSGAQQRVAPPPPRGPWTVHSPEAYFARGENSYADDGGGSTTKPQHTLGRAKQNLTSVEP